MRIISYKFITLIVLIAVVGLIPALAKSDFSGDWKLNASKTDFGPMPPPDTLTEKVTHEDPNIKMSVAQTGGTGDIKYDMAYTTDGKESVNHMGDNEFKTTLKWDGDELVGDTKGSFDGNDFTAKDRWALSDGGKTMTVTRHVSMSMGEFDIKLVFDKQ